MRSVPLVYSLKSPSIFYRFLQSDFITLRFVSFLFALVVYAFFGLPTPDYPGLVELVIALLLVCAVGVSGAWAVLRIDLMAPLSMGAGQVFFVYGLTAPLLMGVMSGQDAVLIVRDVLPFLFLLLPVFLMPLFDGRPLFFRCVLIGVLGVGIVFAGRSILETYDFVLFALFGGESGELTYLANAPTLLFAALFLLGLAGQQFFQTRSLPGIALSFVLFVVAALVMLPLGLTLQRAGLGFAGVYVFVLGLAAFYYYPYRWALLLVAIAAATFSVWDVLGSVFVQLMNKASLVGFNMRFEELAAVWAEISGSLPRVLFGTGWGGTFESPAVAGVRVNFTHGLLTSALLKTGLIGLVLVCFYLYGLGRLLFSVVWQVPILGLALLGPIVIDVFLYASFKSLDFGLVLLLIPTFLASRSGVALRRPLL